MSFSHLNHYVPIWYQQRFLQKSQTSYYRLDKSSGFLSIPRIGCRKNKDISHKGCRKFFCEEDLYTTSSLFSGEQNDEIERYLFGRIDSIGKRALEALVSEDWMSELYEKYAHIFEYMDAQILRTPRGICWLRKLSNAKTQNELMLYLQTIRLMHCVTWLESSKELVSAENANVKFIVSDNPVILYNPRYHPSKGWYQHGNSRGIPIFHKGTRTIFPIDLNHCLILYNIEYTQNPSLTISLEDRANPRFYDEIIFRFDDIDRKKLLTDEEVLKINYLLKNNSDRYVAASRREWLFPENHVNPSWLSYNKFLLPKYPKFTGELFVWGEDGELQYTQDSFGRKPVNLAEWSKKKQEAKKMQENLTKALENERLRKKFQNS